jgi:hypothetical protein
MICRFLGTLQNPKACAGSMGRALHPRRVVGVREQFGAEEETLS